MLWLCSIDILNDPLTYRFKCAVRDERRVAVDLKWHRTASIEVFLNCNGAAVHRISNQAGGGGGGGGGEEPGLCCADRSSLVAHGTKSKHLVAPRRKLNFKRDRLQLNFADRRRSDDVNSSSGFFPPAADSGVTHRTSDVRANLVKQREDGVKAFITLPGVIQTTHTTLDCRLKRCHDDSSAESGCE
ncbi:hypothetical protein F2P81_015376 [Scophthalmus maximus]|uniref:Uncharacterized protein n=1 Tax=Scophthalmus maximus TaxID=52904 RepID=A0A6A4SD65_SCOMX|nr:hypothetical protein F2P81_015376 [Scophthalmus maximus]